MGQGLSLEDAALLPVEDEADEVGKDEAAVAYAGSWGGTVLLGIRHNAESEDRRLRSPLSAIECRDCGLRCSSQRALRRHVGAFCICRTCGKNHCSEGALNEHQEVTGHGEPQYRCDVCLRHFPDGPTLRQHKGFASLRETLCRFCHHRFCNPEELEAHLRDEHDRQLAVRGTLAAPTPQCGVCGTFFSNESELAVHRGLLSGQGRPMTPDASPAASFPMEGHSDRRPLMEDLDLAFVAPCCNTCNRPFCSRVGLKVHMAEAGHQPGGEIMRSWLRLSDRCEDNTVIGLEGRCSPSSVGGLQMG